MPLDPGEQRHLLAAVGYYEMGMYVEAVEALDDIDPLAHHLPEVLTVRLGIFQELKAWELMEGVAVRLAQQFPDDGQWLVPLAYAIRRSQSIENARAILIAGAERFPSVPLIWFNLACYESVMGDFPAAQEWLEEAFALDKGLRRTALEDEDLHEFWQWAGVT